MSERRQESDLIDAYLEQSGRARQFGRVRGGF
jgi:hypothetical protein